MVVTQISVLRASTWFSPSAARNPPQNLLANPLLGMSARSASLRVPRQSAALLARGRGAAQRLDVMLAFGGAVSTQVAPAMQVLDLSEEMTVVPVTSDELDRLTKDYERRLRAYDLEFFNFCSWRVICWWLSGLSEWSMAHPIEQLPSVREQLKALCLPMFIHSFPPLPVDTLQKYGKLAWVLWQHTLPFTIASLVGAIPDGDKDKRASCPTMLHVFMEGVQANMAEAAAENPQLCDFLKQDAKGVWRLCTLPEADALIEAGEAGWLRALGVVHALQQEPGHGARLPAGGTIKLGQFGIGLPDALARSVKRQWGEKMAEKAPEEEEAAALAPVAAPAATKEQPAAASKATKGAAAKAAPAATKQTPAKRPPRDAAAPEGAEGGGGVKSRSEKKQKKKVEKVDYEGQTPSEYGDLQLVKGTHSRNTTGYSNVSAHNTLWRCEKKTGGDDLVGQDVAAPWMAAVEFKMWLDAGEAAGESLSLDEWHADPAFQTFLAAADKEQLISQEILSRRKKE